MALNFPSDPTDGQTYSSSNVTWTYSSSKTSWSADQSVAGSNTHILFNDSGKANGSSYFTFNKSTNAVSVGNSTVNASILNAVFTIKNSNTATANASSISFGNSSVNSVFGLTTITINGSGIANSTGANNAFNLNGQAAAYYTNATNITTGTLPWAQAPTNTVNTTGAFTITGIYTHQVNVHTGNATVNAQISNSVLTINNSNVATLNASSVSFGNSSVNSVFGLVTVTINGAGIANSTGANNAFNLNGVAAASYVNTSGAYTITGIHTHQANITMGNTTVNTQISNASILVSNGTSTTTLGLTDLRVGNTTTNVIIANTTSTFGGNVVITGTANVTANLTISATGNLIFTNGAGIYANGGLGTSGQVLTSNGGGVYWSAASGGSAYFNTGVSASVGYAINTTMSSAYTAAVTAGLRYIVYSIQVTNIGSANATVSGELEGTGNYANISFSSTVPVPVGSSVELLKMPKIMQPSDALKLQSDTASTLHAFITYESQTSTKYFGAGVDVTADATYTDLYTAGGNAVVQSLLLSNDDGTNDVKARVVWTDGSNVIQAYLCYDLIVPADSTVELLEQAKYLPSGHKIRVYANVGNRLEAIISGKLI